LIAGLDQHSLRRALSRAAAGFQQADFLHREIRTRLLNRCDYLRVNPSRILDLGAGTGEAARLMAGRYPDAEVLALDLVPAMLLSRRTTDSRRQPAAICGDAARLPLAARSVDLVFSSLMLQWAADAAQVFHEVMRSLKPAGLFTFATLGAGTLSELRRAWAGADGYTHVIDFMDMKSIGDAMVHAGMADPVLDAESITVTYRSVGDLAKDLRGTGAVNHTMGRNRGLTGRGRWRHMERGYEQHRNEAGLLPASVKVIYAHAWKPAAVTAGKPAGEFEIRAEDILKKTKGSP